MWFVHMPEYQRWIKSGHGTLCYLDSDGAKMSALVSNIVKMGLSLHPVLSQTIYLDCSQYDTSNPAEAEMGALHSLIYQNIFLHPGSLERLSEYFKTIRQPVGRSFNRLFHENMDEGVQPDCGFMVDALRWVIPVDGLPSFTIIDKIDCMTREASQRMLGRLLSKINDEADHILFVGHNDPDLAAKFEGLPTISPRVEAMHCIGSLHFQEWDDRRSIVETPFGDTDEWIWTDPAFVTWRERSGILWIKGKPGCGKSTIARMITDRLARPKERQSTINPAIADPDPDSTIAVNFFYSARMGERATRHYYMLRSILYQMLRQDYSLYVHFKCTYRRILGDGTTWMLEDLMYVFETIIADCSSERPSLCCVLDGFDESDEIECPQPGSQKSKKTQTSMLSWLADLALKQTHGSWLKILVLSRPTTSISRALGAIASITVEEHNLPAIIKLIEDGLSKIKQSVSNIRIR
ncbi:hypothetical protein K505DRAFT_76529 [Melanomma pulvis-pyrius CBS 109.77]|uniref:Nephrocystin 3-like N-terminal domain-containing protein n=1 Tax=Melanomma pulvis-pyrius CBS 109.77 TaxID=1314802 RepID=A0A6A6X3B1_9PLEO|nr:hypothetical protein K505DRAFT_76529 [Melanomma pulvis-pyrius CBS 109.77]